MKSRAEAKTEHVTQQRNVKNVEAPATELALTVMECAVSVSKTQNLTSQKSEIDQFFQSFQICDFLSIFVQCF